MKLRNVLATATAAAVLSFAGAANAALVFVGSWQVDQGPAWDGAGPDGPLAYTGQEAAALLFGGDPGDYSISTTDAEVNFQAWYSILGFEDAGLFGQDFSSKHLGQFYGPTSDHGDGLSFVVSAYVNDRLTGATYTNYAFREAEPGVGTIPEPATWALMIGGFGLAGAALRRRKPAAA